MPLGEMNEFQLMGEELEREIEMIKQALKFKSAQLDETRRKLRTEIVEHQMMKNCVDKSMTEIEGMKMEVDLNVKANAKLEEENMKYRETIAKLQAQVDSYMMERQFLMDRSYNADIEICKLKSHVVDLQDKVREYAAYKERYEQYKSDVRELVDQVWRKQDVLNKEQNRLEKVVKEGLDFATQLSEKLNVQSLFVREANITRIKLEDETIRLISALEQERNEKMKLQQSMSEEKPKPDYLDDWKTSQEETSERVQYLMGENKRLQDEVDALKTRCDFFMEKDNVD